MLLKTQTLPKNLLVLFALALAIGILTINLPANTTSMERILRRLIKIPLEASTRTDNYI